MRRLAYEAADSGLLGPDLAAGIRRVKGAKRLGVRVGNWLTAEEGKSLLATEIDEILRSRRNRALLALLVGCGLRRAEVTALRLEDFQLREGHWVIADLIGKGGHIRTIPVPDWIKAAADNWTRAAGITTGSLLCFPANDFMFRSPTGKPVNMDALARDVIVPLATKAGVQWHGWHAFRRGLATNLYRLGVSDKTIQRILRQANVGVTQACYIKTADSDAAAAMQQFERSLQYAPNMHLSGAQKSQLM